MLLIGWDFREVRKLRPWEIGYGFVFLEEKFIPLQRQRGDAAPLSLHHTNVFGYI